MLREQHSQAEELGGLKSKLASEVGAQDAQSGTVHASHDLHELRYIG